MFKIIGVVAYLSASMGLQADEGWKAIFDGESLEGWTPKFAGYPLGVNFNDTFRVENGVLKASYDQYDRFNGEFGHLFYKLPLSNYRLRMEYRFLGEQTSGACRCRSQCYRCGKSQRLRIFHDCIPPSGHSPSRIRPLADSSHFNGKRMPFSKLSLR